ncbi:hypothetical protein VitviT2T_019827 [Vitis vinifera]|uniref:Disease resistance protein n=1 Tax=Vitis vinifera TaxID=29760 RepID=A0ABY9D2H5_VITVI|nr:hypothetical protein VitviT2T_019827 [Vitis vinifera]
MSGWEYWEDWSSPTKSLFPCLRELTILSCPKLIKKLLTYLPSLTKLFVGNCRKLEFTLLRLPSLKKLTVDECNETVLRSGIELTSLTELTVSGILELIKLQQGFMRSLGGLQALKFSECEELTCLKCLPDGMMRNSNGSSNSCVLESLEITECSSLICLPKGQLPTTLKKLIIGECENLKSLPEGMMHCNSIATTSTMDMCALEYLSLNMCPSLIGFPRGRLPITLKELYISNCEKLESLPEGIMHYDSTNVVALRSLAISHCSSLISFPRGKFPSTLEGLNIWDCEHLESISEEMFHSTNNSFQSLSIARYPNLRAYQIAFTTSQIYILQIIKIWNYCLR